MPITDYNKSNTTLWVESLPNQGDFHPVEINYGNMVSFFGSLCRHFVPDNKSERGSSSVNADTSSSSQCQIHEGFTRISFDFRVGILPYFNPTIELNAKAQHTRREVYI